MYNILIITIDSLRADFLGCYNTNKFQNSVSPYLDAWSNDAVLFQSAISQSANSSPSFLALFSGHYPCKYGDWFGYVSPQRTLASEIFKNNGYFTCGFHSNPYLARFFKWDKGFDRFEDNLSKKENHAIFKPITSFATLYRTVFPKVRGNAEQINAQVASWLNTKIEPFFLWVHYMDVHGPYVSNDSTLKDRISAGRLWSKALRRPKEISNDEKNILLESYKGKITYLDFHINELIKHFDPSNTLIVLTSDHGQCFGEHDSYDHPLELFEELINVPLIIKFPSNMEIRNSLIRHPVRSIDVLPTLVDLLKLRTQNSFDGQSLLPLLNGTEKLYSCNYYISEVSRKHVSVKNDRWKLIVDYKRQLRNLFDLKIDMAETKNVAPQNPEVVKKMESVILQHIDKYKPSDLFSQNIIPDEKISTELKILGYKKKE